MADASVVRPQAASTKGFRGGWWQKTEIAVIDLTNSLSN